MGKRLIHGIGVSKGAGARKSLLEVCEITAVVVGRWYCCAVEALDVDTSAEQAINGEDEKRTYVFTYLDCARAVTTEKFCERFGIRNGEFIC